MGWAGEKLANEIVGLSMSPKAVKCECGKSIVQLGATEFWRLEESGEVCADGHWHKPAQVTPPKPIDTAPEAAPAEAIHPDLCGDPSPQSGTLCIYAAGHEGVHHGVDKIGAVEWTNPAKPESPQAEPSESAGEKDVGVDNPNHYEILKFMNEALVKTHPSEQSHAYRVSKYALLKASQPSTLPQSSQQGHINYLSEALLDKSNAATWGSRNGEPWLGVPTSVVRAIVESAQSQPQSQPSSLAGTFEDWWKEKGQYWDATVTGSTYEMRIAHAAWNAAKQSQPVIEPPDLSGITYFVHAKDGSMQVSEDPYRRDYVSYQDFLVIVEALRKLEGTQK